jgi:glycerol uptake facilitator-like aquaporin
MARIAFGRFDDSFSLGSFKAYLAEFISTLLFVFAGVGSAIAYGYSSFPLLPSPPLHHGCLSFIYLFFYFITGQVLITVTIIIINVNHHIYIYICQ